MRILLTAASLILFPWNANAWWEDGHSVVGKIAEQHLTPEARAGIKELLGDKPISDPEVCVWADRIIAKSPEMDRKYPNHRTWHYINLEVRITRDDYIPDPSNDHVLGAIERLRKVLKDPAAPKSDRKEALMFLVHFLGDMHQPLHCTNRDDDKGGNFQPIKSVRGMAEDKLNLHKVWDGHLVKADRGELTLDDYTKRLLGEITAADRQSWLVGDVKDWIWESHIIGATHVYQFADGTPLPKPNEPPAELTEENYLTANKPVVHLQLKKGGVRLAAILNECFRRGE